MTKTRVTRASDGDEGAAGETGGRGGGDERSTGADGAGDAGGGGTESPDLQEVVKFLSEVAKVGSSARTSGAATSLAKANLESWVEVATPAGMMSGF